jgi:hypothetical protein
MEISSKVNMLWHTAGDEFPKSAEDPSNFSAR